MKIRTTITIDDGLLMKVKILAVKNKKTLGYYIEQALEMFFENEKHEEDKKSGEKQK